MLGPLLILAVGLSVPAHVQGVVLDPQQLAVVEAKVSLDCEGHKFKTRTDRGGRFSLFPSGHAASCILKVQFGGFAPYEERVRLNSEDLIVHLTLPAIKETVIVRGSPDSDLSNGSIVGAVSLSRKQLQKLSNNTEDLIRIAKLMAGTPPIPDDVYVDGLPTRILPPAQTITRITVNADPFSAEYSDGDRNRIDITTGNPDREFHFSMGGGALSFGGHSPLGSGLGSSSSSFSPTLAGAIPRMPVTFSGSGNLGSNWSDQLVQATVPQGSGISPGPSRVPSGGDTRSGTASFYYSHGKATHATFSYNQLSGDTENAGVGGLTLLQAGTNGSSAMREVRASYEHDGERWVSRTGLVLDSSDLTMQAISAAQGLNVLGNFVAGGNPVSRESNAETNWMWKSVFLRQSVKHSWEWGYILSRAVDSEDEIPNPNGEFTIDNLADYLATLQGAPTATWSATQGNGQVGLASTAVAPFVQADIWHWQNTVIRGGVRADYQSRGGVMFSPRLSGVTAFRGFILRAGAGEFAQNWPNYVFVHTTMNDGFHLQQFLASGVPLSYSGGASANLSQSIIARISPGLIRPREIMTKISIERPLGNFIPGLEYTWTDGTHLLGSRRLPFNTGWTDLLESNRDLRRDELHASLRYARKGRMVAVNYTWMLSRDDTDGPFSFPEFQNDLKADWARSTGIPAHNFSITAMLPLPAAIFLTTVGSLRGSSPYNITTGEDIGGDGLFNDRGGRLRNSGDGPGYHTVSLYLYKKIRVPLGSLESKKALFVDMGVQIDNLLDSKNYLNLGSVANSPLFGQPLGALPGRSVRLWFNFDR